MPTAPLRILSVDTSTSAGSIVLTAGEKILGEINLDVMPTHSVRLLPGIDFLLSQTGTTIEEIDVFAVICGPGSFTGIRIGLATVKGLAATTAKPLVPITAFEAWAESFFNCQGVLVPMIDARRNEVYAAIFERRGSDWKPLHSGLVDKPEQVLRGLTPADILFVGDGAMRYRALIESPDHAGWKVIASPAFLGRSMARLAYRKALAGELTTAQDLPAFYLRKSDAELFWKEK